MSKVRAHACAHAHLEFSPFTLYLLQIAVFDEYPGTGQCTTTNADVVCSVVIYCFGLERHLQLG
jgi:hypothetical protein